MLSCIEVLSAGRVDPAERSHNIAGFWSTFQFWAGCNVTPLNIVLGILGIFHFRLRAVDGFTITIIASSMGSMATGAIARYGPLSGLRTMTIARFTHGWHASRIISIFNALMLVAFLVVDTISCRDIIRALVPDHAYAPTIAVVVLGAVAILFAVVGGSLLDFIGRWAWRPQLISMAMLVGGCLVEIYTRNRSSLPTSNDPPSDDLHLRLGYGVLVCNAVLVFSMAGGDFSHAFSENSPQWKVTMGPTAGLATSHIVFVSVGLVIGETARGNEVFTKAFSESPAALIGLCFQRLGPVGILCAVCFVVGSFGAIAAGMYVAAVPLGPTFQRYGRWTRVACTVAIGVAVVICGNVGRDHLATILQSIVSIAGSLVLVWWVSSIMDMELARRTRPHWPDWNVPTRLPCRLHTVLASAVGTTCAILAVDESWYTGPIARVAGPSRSFIGPLTTIGATAVVILPLSLLKYRRTSSESK